MTIEYELRADCSRPEGEDPGDEDSERKKQSNRFIKPEAAAYIHHRNLQNNACHVLDKSRNLLSCHEATGLLFSAAATVASTLDVVTKSELADVIHNPLDSRLASSYLCRRGRV